MNSVYKFFGTFWLIGRFEITNIVDNGKRNDSLQMAFETSPSALPTNGRRVPWRNLSRTDSSFFCHKDYTRTPSYLDANSYIIYASGDFPVKERKKNL